MKKLFSVFFIIVFCVNLFGQSQQPSTKKLSKLYPTKKITSHYHNHWTQQYYLKRIKLFKEDPLNFGDIVFLGNSITEAGYDWSKRYGVANIRNRGIAGDVTDGVLKRLDEIIYFKPKAVIILIGINDLLSLHNEKVNPTRTYDKIVPSPEYVGNNILKIAKIIHAKSPDTKIYVRTLLPIQEKYEYLKEDIYLVNKIIKKNEVKGFYEVIDLYAQFTNSNGKLIKELTTDDLHLNDKGYRKWIEFEKPIIEGF